MRSRGSNQRETHVQYSNYACPCTQQEASSELGLAILGNSMSRTQRRCQMVTLRKEGWSSLGCVMASRPATTGKMNWTSFGVEVLTKFKELISVNLMFKSKTYHWGHTKSPRWLWGWGLRDAFCRSRYQRNICCRWVLQSIWALKDVYSHYSKQQCFYCRRWKFNICKVAEALYSLVASPMTHNSHQNTPTSARVDTTWKADHSDGIGARFVTMNNTTSARPFVRILVIASLREGLIQSTKEYPEGI